MKLTTIDPEDKGAAIRFQSGKYLGLTGWFDKSRTQPPVKFHVIVDKGNDKGFYTSVPRSSVALPFSKPKNEVENAVQQVALIEKHMSALCQVLVRCHISRMTPELIELLNTKLLEADMQNEGTKSKPSMVYDIKRFDDDDDNESKMQ
jgi:hypothetical protein